jgi:hypothetical protein
MAEREYTLLKKYKQQPGDVALASASELWANLGPAKGHNEEQVASRALKEHGPGTYAVLARFNPLTVKTETVEKVVISGSKRTRKPKAEKAAAPAAQQS